MKPERRLMANIMRKKQVPAIRKAKDLRWRVSPFLWVTYGISGFYLFNSVILIVYKEVAKGVLSDQAIQCAWL
jgi:hypothetical protein